MKNHTLNLSNEGENILIKVSGVAAVNVLMDKEAQLGLENGRLIIRGSGINANKFDVENGMAELNAHYVQSMAYTAVNKQKTVFKDLFK
ncbi:MAG: hypothetical protein RR316_04355 [Clostridia bacterium]